MENNPIFFADGADPKMFEAYKKAQETFKYFWREQSWEYRRIIPGLNVSCVKVAFSQEDPESEYPIVEQMWINDIDFDGDYVKGYLINEPNELTNVEVGDYVEIPLNEISDWLFAITPTQKKPKGLSKLFSSYSTPNPKTYGGFTLLHRETVAGNLSSVEILLKSGADKKRKNKSGKNRFGLCKAFDSGFGNKY